MACTAAEHEAWESCQDLKRGARCLSRAWGTVDPTMAPRGASKLVVCSVRGLRGVRWQRLRARRSAQL